MPLSNDLRERILAAVDNCEGSRRQIAARFCVNGSSNSAARPAPWIPGLMAAASHPRSITTVWSGSERWSGSGLTRPSHRCVSTSISAEVS